MSRGFTLIEMMIVFAIVGITAAVLAPAFQKAMEDTPFEEQSVEIRRNK